MKSTPQTHGAALVITLAMIAMLTFLLVAFLSRSVANLQIESASTSATRADLLARSAGETIISDFRSEIVAGSTTAGSVSQSPVYLPKNLPTDPKYFPTSVPAAVRSTTVSGSIFANLVKQSTGRFYPSTDPYDSNVKPIIQSVTNVTTDIASPNGRSVINKRWDNPADTLVPAGPLLLVSPPPPAAPPNYTRFYKSDMLPHWVMMTRQGVPADQTIFVSDWTNYAPENPNAAIGRFAYNIYNVGGLLDVNAAGYEEDSGATMLSVTAAGQKGTPGLAKLSLIPNMGSSAPESVINADRFVKTWRNSVSGSSAENYLAYLGFSKSISNGTTTDLFDNPFFMAGPRSGFMKAAVGTNSADNHVLGRQDLIRLAVKTPATGSSGPPYGLNIYTLPYLTHFSREVNAPSWFPMKDEAGIYTYKTSMDSAVAANRFFPNVRVGKNPNWRRLTGESAVEGEPLIKYRFPLSWLALLQDADPTTKAWELTLEAKNIIVALDARNIANGGPGLYPYGPTGTDQAKADKAVTLVRSAFGLDWDPLSYQWTYLGSITSPAPTAVSIALLGDAAAAPSTPTPVCRDNREPNFFELLKAGILSGSLGNSSDFESMCVSTGEDGNPDYQIMQIGANIIDQADTDSYPTRIAFGKKYDNPPKIKEPKTAQGGANAPAPLEQKVFSGVEDLPYIYTFLSTPYRIPAGQKDLNQDLPGPDVAHPDVKAQNAKRDMLDCWLQFVMWKPHQPPATAPATPTKFQIVFNGEFLRLFYFRDTSATSMFGGRDFSNGTYTEPVLSSATVNFDDSTDFRVPTVLGGMGGGILHNFTVSQSQGGGASTPRGMWMGEMYRPENDPSDAYYKNAPQVIHTEFRAKEDIKIELQYQDAGGNWRTYQRYDRFAGGTGTYTYGGRTTFGYADDIGTLKNMIGGATGGDWQSPPYYRHLDVSNLAISAIDPRSHRYGLLAHYRDFGPTNQTPSMLPSGNWTYYLKEGWAPKAFTPYSMGFNPSSSDGRFNPNWQGGTRPNPWDQHDLYNTIRDPTSFWVDNSTTAPSPLSTSTPQVPQYYKDMDGVQRRGDGDSQPPTSNGVRPIQLVNTSTTTPPTANTRDLGRVLNRPFRSVGELGYVFRDEPYKSLNLFTDKSADSALLDLFSVNEQPAVIAGKVNLNTKNPEVLQALIASAAREEQSTTNTISAADALDIAQKLVSNTSTYAGVNTNTGPLVNPADLANRLDKILLTSSSDPNTTIKTRREAVGRALAGSGQTRTWNFLIDLIAQSGRYPTSATTPAQFVVEGEKRYWLHVAIDRFTGQVVDQQLESVME